MMKNYGLMVFAAVILVFCCQSPFAAEREKFEINCPLTFSNDSWKELQCDGLGHPNGSLIIQLARVPFDPTDRYLPSESNYISVSLQCAEVSIPEQRIRKGVFSGSVPFEQGSISYSGGNYSSSYWVRSISVNDDKILSYSSFGETGYLPQDTEGTFLMIYEKATNAVTLSATSIPRSHNKNLVRADILKLENCILRGGF